MRHRITAVLASATAVIAAASIGAASPATADGPESAQDLAARWLARDLDLSLEQARSRVANQPNLAKQSETIERSLGGRVAGSYIDQSTGKLMVNVTNSAAAEEVSALGATPRTVSHSLEQLESARTQALGQAGDRVLEAAIDPVRNQTVLTVAAADAAQVASTFAGDDAIQVTSTDATISTQADVFGGQQIEFSGYVCSLGFNARRGSANVFITAGHCAEGYQTFRRSGQTLGKTQAYSFPGNDYAYSSQTATFNGRGLVDRYDGSLARVSGYSKAPVGTAVCKSGRTTKWTCGQIQAHNVTVNYGNADGSVSQVSGLTKANACTEGGDSGGPWLAGTSAQGVTSGGAGYGSNRVCGERVGRPNIAYYQPVGEILNAYGLTLKTS